MLLSCNHSGKKEVWSSWLEYQGKSLKSVQESWMQLSFFAAQLTKCCLWTLVKRILNMMFQLKVYFAMYVGRGRPSCWYNILLFS